MAISIKNTLGVTPIPVRDVRQGALPQGFATPPADAEPGEARRKPAVRPSRSKLLMFTYQTQAGETFDLLTADDWVKIQLLLENAGPVAVGTSANLEPVLSGKGVLLTTGVVREFILEPGGRLYIAADAVNRVNVIIEPLPLVGGA